MLATLIRLLGDFDLAEEALHDAVAAALGQWPREGVPQNPRAWLVSTGRFKAIDAARRRARFHASVADLATRLEHTQPPDAQDEASIDDDHLRLIFTCCHPALPLDAQVALTLREVCGLTTEEIARAFLTTPLHHRPADRARQGEDPRRAHPLSGARGARVAGPRRCRPARGLPGVQRGLLGLGRCHAHPPRSVRRGDPARTSAGAAGRGAGGHGPAGADAAARIASARAHHAGGRPDSARAAGPVGVGPPPDR